MSFETKDFVAISTYKTNFLKSLPKSYTKITCDEDLEINYFTSEFDENSKSYVRKQFIRPIADYTRIHREIIWNSLTIEHEKKVVDMEIKQFNREEREEKTNADKFFLWRKCYGKYNLEGIYIAEHRFIYLPDFHDDIFFGIMSLLISDRRSFIPTDENSDIDMNSSVLFVDLPILSDYDVNEYLQRMIYDHWIDTNREKQKIPFKSDKVTKFPCATKLDLMTLFLYKFPDPNIKFVKIALECINNYECFSILGINFTNHIVFGYRSLESNKIMIVDPAVSNEAFPLSYESLHRKGMLNPTVTRVVILKHLTYTVSAPNIGYSTLIFWLQHEMKINDDIFRKVIDDNKYCLDEDSSIKERAL